MRNEANRKLKIHNFLLFIRVQRAQQKAMKMFAFKNLVFRFFFRWSQRLGVQIMISESLMMCAIILAVNFLSRISKSKCETFLCSSINEQQKKRDNKFNWKLSDKCKSKK